MRLGAVRNNGDDSGYAQLSAFFDGPLHAIELEYRHGKRKVWSWMDRDHFSEFEIDPAVANGADFSAPDIGASCDVEFLSNAGTQHAG
jgi:hypothetical protein